MEVYRRLLHFHLCRVFPLRFCSSSFSALQGFGGSLCYYSGQKGLSIENEVIDDGVVRIRREFHATKQSFLRIPEDLKSMPKMNPEGLFAALRCYRVNATFPKCDSEVNDYYENHHRRLLSQWYATYGRPQDLKVLQRSDFVQSYMWCPNIAKAALLQNMKDNNLVVEDTLNVYPSEWNLM